MGNNVTFIGEVESSMESGEIELNLTGGVSEHIYNALSIIGSSLQHSNNYNCSHSNNLPVIRKKPDLRRLIETDLYKEIKASCGLPPTSKLPCERWSLLRGLQKREHGLAAPRSSSFTVNQQRSIANLFIPNQKESRLMSLESKVFICKFNKDGSKLITACQDGLVRIFDSSKGTYHRMNRIRARDVSWSIIDADFSPCGRFFAYSTWSKSFFIMPISGSGDECQWIDLNCFYSRFAIFSLRYSPCGRKLIGGSNYSSMYLSDIETRHTQELRTHRYPMMDINAVSYISDYNPNVVICGCDNGTVKLFDLRATNRIRNVVKSESQFVGHYDGITYIDSRNDGNYFLTNSKDQSIKIWDLRRPSPLRRCRRSNADTLEWDYRWDTVPYSFYNPKKPLEDDCSVMTYRGHRVSKTLLRAKWSPALQTGQRFIYTGCATGRIIIYDVLTGKIREAIVGHKNVLRDLDWHPVRSEIISGSWDTHVNLYTFRRNASASQISSLKRRSNSQSPHEPLRRSRRIADRRETSADPPETSESATSQRDEEGLTFKSRLA